MFFQSPGVWDLVTAPVLPFLTGETSCSNDSSIAVPRNDHGAKTVRTNTRKPATTADNSLAAYIRDIAKVPRLTLSEELRCIRLAKAGSTAARERLITANLRLVVHVAKGYHSSAFTLGDLISEGVIGLMKAIDKFDPDKGVRFASYAVWWILQGIRRAIGERTDLIHVPRAHRPVAGVAASICPAAPSARRNMSSRPDCSSQSSSEINPQRVRADVTSLDAPIGSEEGCSTLVETIADERVKTPDDVAIEGAVRDLVQEALHTLSRREADILQLRFGISCGTAMTLKMVGERHNLTIERIRQIQEGAIRQLRRLPNARTLAACLVRADGLAERESA